MAHSVSKRIKRALYRFALRRAYRDLLEEEFARRVVKSVTASLGPFLDGRDFAGQTVSGIPSESGVILGDLAHALRRVARPADTLLLAGERNSAKPAYGGITGIPENRILTAGLHGDMDFAWDYETSPPKDIPPVHLIASHAMLEHLLDPYRHLSDCFGLLAPGGHLAVHTVLPGFQYHRFPVDCLRFYPDWFEVAAQRLGAEVASRSVSTEGHLVYCLRKPADRLSE